MNCPRCNHPDSRVVDTRGDAGHIRRRRVCERCGHRFTTREFTDSQLAEYTTRKRGDLLKSAQVDAARLAADASALARKMGV